LYNEKKSESINLEKKHYRTIGSYCFFLSFTLTSRLTLLLKKRKEKKRFQGDFVHLVLDANLLAAAFVSSV